ncbi:MAG: GtrA family protein [Candidatus Paceibacterota bacterium]|jgi:putative flippase GtrA
MLTKLVAQIAKFGTVGVMNTVIDILVLNLLTQIFKFRKSFSIKGKRFMIANVISVTISLINSFIFNRYWTFQATGNVAFQGIKFMTVALIGAYLIQQPAFNKLYNSFYSILPFLRPKEGEKKDFWRMNISKVIAILLAAVWDFLGYKLFAFK